MKAARIHKYGPPEVIVIDDLPIPEPKAGEIIVRTAAAGVGPWDALIREGKAVVNSPLPLILGSELAGVVEAIGPGVSEFKNGDEVYGATNHEFYGAYTEFAVASASTIAHKPEGLSHLEAASVPVVAVTAWQMLFEYAKMKAGQTVLIHGGAGNVGAYAIQLASQAGIGVTATASTKDLEYVKGLGAATVIDYMTTRFEDVISPVDVVLDTVGGETQQRSYSVVKRGGMLVSIVTPFPDEKQYPGIRKAFFIVEVNTDRLKTLSDLFDQGKLSAQVGTVLPLEQAKAAHQMLAGAPHKRGKILLTAGR